MTTESAEDFPPAGEPARATQPAPTTTTGSACTQVRPRTESGGRDHGTTVPGPRAAGARPDASARRRRTAALLLGGADLTTTAAAALVCGGTDTGPLLAGPAVGGVLALHARAGMYRPGLDPHALEELPALAARVSVAWCVAFACLAAFGRSAALSWTVLLTGVAANAGLSCTARALVHGCRRHRARRRPRTALIVGSDETAHTLAGILTERPRYGLRPVGFVDFGPAPSGPEEAVELHVDGRNGRNEQDGWGSQDARDGQDGDAADAARVGGAADTPCAAGPAGAATTRTAEPARAADTVDGKKAAGDGQGTPLPVVVVLDDVTRAVIQNTVQDVIFLRSPWEDPRYAALAGLLGERGVTGWLVRPGCALGAHGSHASGPAHVWGFSCRRLLLDCPRTRTGWRKRLLDVVLVTPALLLAAPVMAACALAVRLSDGPGVIFRQERIGEGGRPFTLLKFRTVRPADERESATRWSVADDHRMSRVGGLLRRTSLDELPQLWNVLRGDMSLVGPRPERPFFVQQFSQAHPGYAHRHRMPVGITGLAQVHGLRGNTSIADRARFDNHYIETWSLWQDVRIMCRTVTSFFRLEGR